MNNNNYHIKITKKIKLNEICNEMVHNYYYLIHGKILNNEKTKYKPFKFVLFFDAFDIHDYFEIDYYNNNDIKNYIDDLIFAYTDMIKNYNDCNDFYNLCNETIIKYNNLNKWRV